MALTEPRRISTACWSARPFVVSTTWVAKNFWGVKSGASMRVNSAWRARAISCLALFLATPVEAHHPGGGGNTGSGGPINTISAGTLDEGQITAAIRYEFIRLGQLSDADLIAAANQGKHGHSIGSIEAFSLSAAYGITDDLLV